MKDCEVAYSWGEGIVVFGKENTVDNCLIHDIDWICTDAAPIHTSGSGHIITNNTIWNGSQSMGSGGGNQVMENQIVYNNLSNSGAWFGTDVQRNLTHTDPRVMNTEVGDFRLEADSSARDDYLIGAMLQNGGFEAGTTAWTGAGCDIASIADPVHSGQWAVHASNRDKYRHGVRQNITTVLNDYGPGPYTLEAWMKLANGTTNGYLRFKIIDDEGAHYPGIKKTCPLDNGTKISYTTNLNWKGVLQEGVFELMTTTADSSLEDLYVNDCALITSASSDTEKPCGCILIPGITDDVVDGNPDAGAYEVGGTHANWRAGSSLLSTTPDLP